jgi:hypothetical protein
MGLRRSVKALRGAMGAKPFRLALLWGSGSVGVSGGMSG